MLNFHWLSNEMEEDMAEKLLSTLCTNSLALSGFSFTSLAVFLGFYKDNLQQASTIIQYLIIATVLFFISSEVAREGHTVGEYIASEFIYLIASLFVFLGFIDFVLRNAWLTSSGIIWVLIVALGLFVTKLTWSACVTVDRIIQEQKRKKSSVHSV